jgi:putative oxidoreductase
MVKVYGKLCGALDSLQSPLLLMIRLYWGYQFFVAGKGKLMNLERVAGFFADLGIPFSGANAVLAGATECVGGLLLMLGVFTRLISIPLAFVMIVAYATAHRDAVVIVIQSIQGFSFSLDEFVKQEPFPFLMTVLVLMAFGPGRFSIDAWIKRKFGNS